eukprot:TRINITY_DN8423_c0_g2_i1.p1 TRINITY_DN8423_c0_g2~~TRINITY_DN8423_c0_g2_i1.p1  ORF type:complete len:481 (+),score=168.83 TRINITY_DN8423_c0_g2_i1:84-1526(+)
MPFAEPDGSGRQPRRRAFRQSLPVLAAAGACWGRVQNWTFHAPRARPSSCGDEVWPGGSTAQYLETGPQLLPRSWASSSPPYVSGHEMPAALTGAALQTATSGPVGSAGAFGRSSPAGSSTVRRASESAAEAEEESNPWRDDPSAALDEAMARADAEWAILSVQAEVQGEAAKKASSSSSSSSSGSGSAQETRAAEILVSSALDRLRPYTIPAEYIDIPPLRGSEEALKHFLQEDAGLVLNFLSENGQIGRAGRAFWEAELYLRSVQETPGEKSLEQAVQDAGEEVAEQDEDMREALQGSVLLARQNFISAARFGYFLQRSRQRLSLERMQKSFAEEETVAESSDAMDFLSALRDKVREAAGSNAAVKPPEPEENELDAYLGKLPAKQAVELVRVATVECQAALETRASALFGTERDLLREFETGRPGAVQQLQLSKKARLLLNLEAAAFGAALFDAEETAARQYELQYTEFGERLPGRP